jgi:hypothetical protein
VGGGGTVTRSWWTWRWWTWLRRQPARWVGLDPDRFDRAMPCHQCGRPDGVYVLRLSRRRARVWCQRCGAVVRVADLAVLRPYAALRSGREGGAVPVDPALRLVMPPEMLAWARARASEPLTAAALDKRTICRLYRDWDARTGGGDPAAGGDTGPAAAGLPSFSAVLGVLDDICYRTDLALAAWHPAVSDGQEPPAALRQRVLHARNWLAQHGATASWLYAGVDGDSLVEPDRAEVVAATAGLRSGGVREAAAARAARAALFGTRGGPPLEVLQRVYPPEVMVEALGVYLESGSRPLRADALARLHRPEPDPAGPVVVTAPGGRR